MRANQRKPNKETTTPRMKSIETEAPGFVGVGNQNRERDERNEKERKPTRQQRRAAAALLRRANVGVGLGRVERVLAGGGGGGVVG